MPKVHDTTSPITPVLINVPAACHILSCGKSTLYELIKRGEIRSTKFGGKRVLSRAEVEEYAERLMDATPKVANGEEAAP